jgi:predicted nucleotidyltransferase
MNNKKIFEKTAFLYLQKNDVSFAGLFGSCARGSSTYKSDIDLLVRFSKPKSLFDLVRMENDLSTLLHKKVDLVTELSISPYMRDGILRDLKPIYGERT